jgi:hypothetical protein
VDTGPICPVEHSDWRTVIQLIAGLRGAQAIAVVPLTKGETTDRKRTWRLPSSTKAVFVRGRSIYRRHGYVIQPEINAELPSMMNAVAKHESP